MPPRILGFTLLAVMTTLAMTAGCAPSGPAAPQTPPTPPEARATPPPEPQAADIVAETILEAPLGEGPGELGAVFPESAMERVPAAFAVARDAVLILDTLKARVLEYRGGRLARTVPFPDVIEGASLAVDAQGDWYIYDAVGDFVLQASPAGEVKARWPVPERLREGAMLLLKPGAWGEVVLALGTAGQGEYGLAKPLAGPTPGFSFRGSRARYVLKSLGPGTMAVCGDGEEKWRLSLSGASLLGFDACGRLIVVGADWSLERSLLVLALRSGGGVTRAILEVKTFEGFPEPPLVLGDDGELYFLAFTREEAVVQRLSLKPR